MKKKTYITALESLSYERFIVKEINNLSIGLIRYDNGAKCFLNVCPHAGAPVCRGSVSALLDTAEGELVLDTDTLILKCPWHGWEFRVADGNSVVPGIGKLVEIKTELENGEVYIYL